MKIPKLKQSPRDSEYKKQRFENISKITYAWLFQPDLGHRELDKEILGVSHRKGFLSLEILGFLGLKKEFKGIFKQLNFGQAIKLLEEDSQDFSLIIELLKCSVGGKDALVVGDLYEIGKSRDKNFVNHCHLRLSELMDTDRNRNQGQTRMEQGILRELLFKDLKKAKCALCHRVLPTELMVAAHIKPRSKCNASERKNPNVVMPVCKIGCDDFFEKGYLIVDAEGKIASGGKVDNSSELGTILNSYKGKLCTHFNEGTKKFFKDKRKYLQNL